MDFSLSAEQVAFQKTAKNFSKEKLAPNAANWDNTAYFPVDIIKEAANLGFCALNAKQNMGGLELSRLDTHLIFEQLSMGCTSTAAYISIHNMVTWLISCFATEEAKQQWGKQLTSGEVLTSYCLTESGSGSDAASLQTKAQFIENEYIITGNKAFISGAGSTELLLVMARTGESGPKGISAFIVPSNLPGISFGKKEAKMGWNSQPTRTIAFDQVRIPAYYRLGEEGEGFTMAMMGLDGGRINIASCSLGTAQAALDHAKNYSQERSQFGHKLSEFQSMQFKLADMYTELTAARQMVRFAAYKLDQKHPDTRTYCAMAKRFATDIGFNVCNEALQIYGGYGYIKEYPLERFVRDTRVHQILEGTNEIMRLIIARRVISQQSFDLT